MQDDKFDGSSEMDLGDDETSLLAEMDATVEVEIEFVVPGAGPKRVDVDLEPAARTGDDTFVTHVDHGTHAIDFAGQGAPHSPYHIAVTKPDGVDRRFDSHTDGVGRAVGALEFTV